MKKLIGSFATFLFLVSFSLDLAAQRPRIDKPVSNLANYRECSGVYRPDPNGAMEAPAASCESESQEECRRKATVAKRAKLMPRPAGSSTVVTSSD